jgi:hypothetical protein
MNPHLYDRAAVVAAAAMAIIIGAEDIGPDELQAQLEALIRDELEDLENMVAADRGELP